MSLEVPEHLDWRVWRILTHKSHMASGLAEIERDWSFEDLMNANDALDLIGEAEARARGSA